MLLSCRPSASSCSVNAVDSMFSSSAALLLLRSSCTSSVDVVMDLNSLEMFRNVLEIFLTELCRPKDSVTRLLIGNVRFSFHSFLGFFYSLHQSVLLKTFFSSEKWKFCCVFGVRLHDNSGWNQSKCNFLKTRLQGGSFWKSSASVSMETGWSFNELSAPC